MPAASERYIAMKKLSIIIPTWNRAEEVLRAVNSIGPLSDDIEVIIVDNASDQKIYDRLLNILPKSNNIKIFQNSSNLGMIGNWNKCLSHASGEWIGILCSDDIYNPGAIVRLMSVTCQNTVPSLILQDPQMNEDIVRCAAGSGTLKNMRIPQCSGTFWHRKIFEEIGGFDDRFEYSGDIEYWFRAASRFPVIKVKQMFAEYRKGDESYMWDTWHKKDFLEVSARMSESIYGHMNKSGELSAEDIDKKVSVSVSDTIETILFTTVADVRHWDLFLMYFPKYLASQAPLVKKISLVPRLMRLVLAKLKSKIFRKK